MVAAAAEVQADEPLPSCSYVRDRIACGREAFRLVDGKPGCSRHWQMLLREQLAAVGRAVVVSLRPARS